MKDSSGFMRGIRARLCAAMGLFLCLPNALPIIPVGNSRSENSQSGDTRTALQLDTSVVETRYCSPSNLEVNLRLEFKNTGAAVLLFPKNSLVMSRYMVSRTLKAASRKDYELDVSPMVNTALMPKLDTEAAFDNLGFEILKPGDSYATNRKFRIPFVSHRHAVTQDSLRPGDYFLQIKVWTSYESPLVVEKLRSRWRQEGYLWSDPLTSSPMPFAIPRKQKVSQCK